ncbi:MAG: hypothetical protein AAGG72_06415, partial [Pseudomonadota bacterium]
MKAIDDAALPSGLQMKTGDSKPIAGEKAAWQHAPMKKRQSFEAGHLRKFLLVIDDCEEVDAAVFYAANRVAHSGGSLVMHRLSFENRCVRLPCESAGRRLRA